MSGVLLGMVLSVCSCWFHNMVTFSSKFLLTLVHVGTSAHCIILSLLVACVKVYLKGRSIVSLYVTIIIIIITIAIYLWPVFLHKTNKH